MRYEAVGEEGGDTLVLDETGATVLRLPYVGEHEGAVVCEFRRTVEHLSLDEIVGLIRREVLEVFMGGCYDQPMFELVDLDGQRWARMEQLRAPAQWTHVRDAWPPGIDERTTSLVGAPTKEALEPAARFDGFRNKLSAMALSADGDTLLVAYGNKGHVQQVDVRTGKRTKVGEAVGGLVREIFWSGAQALAWADGALHRFDGKGWRREELGADVTSVAMNTRAQLALGHDDGRVRVLDEDGAEVACFMARTGAEAEAETRPMWSRSSKMQDRIWGIAWLDESRVVTGHTWPVLAVFDVKTGAQCSRVVGTQHFVQHFVAQEGRLMASLTMGQVDVFSLEERFESHTLPNGTKNGLALGAIHGDIAVMQCDEPFVRIWKLSEKKQIAQANAAKREPLVVHDGRLITRDGDAKTLNVYMLPE